MYVVYINLLYFLSIFLFTYNKNLLSPKKRQRAMLLEVHKCIHELGPRYRHGMFSQKSRACDYRTPQY